MFSRAPVKRFNDKISETPGPDAYDVKELASKGLGIAAVKSDRFAAPKDVTPGPGQYDVEAANKAAVTVAAAAFKVRQSKLHRQSSFRGMSASSKAGSRTSSTSSLYTEVDDAISFKTPSKKNIPIHSDVTSIELALKYEQVCRDLTAANEELSKHKIEAEKIRQNLEEKVHQLESGVKSKENELATKISELEKISEERSSTGSEISCLQNQLEQVKSRELALTKELELLNQDNLTLEEKVDESTKALLEEKEALEEKSTFLHFTQEQLNHQVQTLEQEVAKLRDEVEELKVKLEESEQELASERSKLVEFTEMYVKENKESENEFSRLQTEVQTLKQQNKSLDEERSALECQLKELVVAQKQLLDEKEDIKAKLEEANQDLEVFGNDKEVLDSERKRLEKDKSDLGLDLMSVTCEKIEVEKKLDNIEKEKIQLASQIEELVKEKKKIEETFQLSKDEKSRLELQLVELTDVAMKQKITLDAKDQTIGDLQLEIEEMEMKNSSLEGSLSATQNEVANLEVENKALFSSFEKVEETVRGYIHKCQHLEIQADELAAAKEDLNQTCLILERRMKIAEEAFENKSSELENVSTRLTEADQLVEKLRGDFSSLESQNRDMQELIGILQQRHDTCLEIASETESGMKRKISQLEESLLASLEKCDKLGSDLESVRGECQQLLDLNTVLSQQVTDSLSTTDKLTAREEELNRRLEKALHELDLVHQGMNTELDQRWEAEDEILQLQTEIDQVNALLQEANEQIKIVESQLRLSEINYESVFTAKSNLEVKFSNLKLNHDKTVQDLSMFQQEQDEVNARVKTEVELRSNLEKKLMLAEGNKEVLTDKLDMCQEQISSLRLSLEAQQSLISEQESRIEALEDELAEADQVERRFKEMEVLLGEYMADNKELEEKEAALEKSCKLKDKMIAELRQELDPLQEETETYKDKYEALLLMIEPFKEQLEAFELEKAALLSQNQEAKGEVKKLASQYAQLLGHQNHKQKIQHLVKIKEENVGLREQIAKLQLENAKQKRALLRIDSEKRSASANRTVRFNATQQFDDKENDDSVFYTPMPSLDAARSRKSVVATGHKIPFAASTPQQLRRQSIASPLQSRNGP